MAKFIITGYKKDSVILREFLIEAQNKEAALSATLITEWRWRPTVIRISGAII